ncbi:MAG: hypothetical protein FWG93_04490 [Oscillospiraceae bacterium]|nr:hypothetical protein [Oscillospiraceae bacterium]
MKPLKSLSRSSLHVLAALAAGAAGFVLRGVSLAREYDAVTHLVRRGAPFGIALIILCSLSGVLLYFLVPKGRPRRKAAMPMLYLFLDLPAAAALALSGILTTFRYLGSGTPDSGRLPVLAMAMLTLFTALCVVIVALRLPRGAIPSGYGFYLAVPVFWACLNLFGDFFEHSGNPVLSDYAYILLSYVAVTLALLGACSRFYLGHVASRAMPFYASLSVMLSTIALAGPTLAKWILGDAPLPRAAAIPANRQLVLLFILLHSLALLWLSARNAFDGNFTPKYKDADEPQPDGVSPDIDIVLGLDDYPGEDGPQEPDEPDEP